MEKLNLGVLYFEKTDGIKYGPKKIDKISRLLEEKVPYVISVRDLFNLCKKNELDREDFFDEDDFINWIEGLDGLRANSDIDRKEYWVQHPREDLKLSDYLMILFKKDPYNISLSDLEPIDMYPVSENILEDHNLAKDAYDHFFYTYDNEIRTVRYVEKVLG